MERCQVRHGSHCRAGYAFKRHSVAELKYIKVGVVGGRF